MRVHGQISSVRPTFSSHEALVPDSGKACVPPFTESGSLWHVPMQSSTYTVLRHGVGRLILLHTNTYDLM